MQETVEKLIQAIDSGVKPWVMPFDCPSLGRPQNFLNQTRYKGANAVLLHMEAYLKGYSCNKWLTYNQISELKGKVRKGERAKKVFFFTYVEKTLESEPDSENAATIKSPRWKYFNVFNLDQTEGIADSDHAANLSEDDFMSNLSVDGLIAATKAVINHSDRKAAFYNPNDDFIHLPYQRHFHSVDGYYATLLHELVHWTGHQSRLHRLTTVNRYGNHAYCFEELVAELGSTFLSMDLNVKADIENHASYLENWSKLLQDKHMAFFKAASLAETAMQYLYDLASKQQENNQFALSLEAA